MQWVAMRMIDTPRSRQARMSSIVPSAGQHQRGDGRAAGGGGDGRLHQAPLVDGGEAVVVRRAGQSVAVGDLDDGHARSGESVDDGGNVGFGELVALGVGAVAQRGVGDADVERVGVGHQLAATDRVARLAISSPTFTAAAVMMSRLPA